MICSIRPNLKNPAGAVVILALGLCLPPRSASAQVLTLEVNTPTGRTLLINSAGQSIDFDFYEIQSPLFSLNPFGWKSLQDQGIGDNGIPNDGIGWETLGAPATNLLAEAFLFGSTVVADGNRYNLGYTFTPGMAQDVTFHYQAPDGTPFAGMVTFDPTVLGDMDGSGVFDAFDVGPFELALADPAGYDAMFPGLDADVLGDIDGNGVLDAFDVTAFEQLLAGECFCAPLTGTLVSSAATGMPVPEPATIGVLTILGLALQSRRPGRRQLAAGRR